MFEQLRKTILDKQEINKMWNNIGNHLIHTRSMLASEGLPMPLRCAMRTGDVLSGIHFECLKEELLVGRFLDFPKANAEEQTVIDAHPEYYCFGPGQTGHCEPDYQMVMAQGIAGVEDDIRSFEQTENRKCFLIALSGFKNMIRNASEAALRAGNHPVAEICDNLYAGKAPQTYQEALQLLWFVCLAVQIGDSVNLVGPGRLDKILGGFYLNDVRQHRLDRTRAVEIMATMYLFYNDFTGRSVAFGAMVGGDVVNEVSYIALEALKISRLVYPSVGVCVSEKTPDDLLMSAIDIIAEGIPNPAFFNHQLIKDSMIRHGVPPEEAGNYINSTCVEITPCGASNVYVASPYFNLMQLLIEVMDQEYGSFEELILSYHQRLAQAIARAAAQNNSDRRERQRVMRRPLQSVFTRDCIAKNKDIEEGGAKYNWAECSFVGLANTVDSFMVIKEEVFVQRNLTMGQMLKLIETDYQGNEELRIKFLNRYPKYGTDCAGVDAFIPLVIDFVKDECAKYRMYPDDSPFIPGVFCWEMHQRLGLETIATPDGRKAKFPFADGAGPAQGREKLGPTSAINSVCSWNHCGLLGGSAFNMKFSHAVFKNRQAKEKLLALIKTFIANGGFETQINVVSNEILKEAIARPEQYAGLVVRIGGYTDYFAKMSKEMQLEVLQRMEYQQL